MMGTATTRRAPAHRPSRGALVSGALAVGAIALVVAVTVVGLNAQTWLRTLTARPPAVGTKVVVAADSKAAQSAADAAGLSKDESAAAEYLAAQPTAHWLTPEQHPIDQVWDSVAGLAAQAREQGASLAVVVYGLPGRDCGSYSAGGLDPAEYQGWTERIGAALRNAQDVTKIVVLEPDSLALAPECGNVDERVEQLTAAADRLAGVDTWIYLDGGHSNWLPPARMAELLRAVGLPERARGFATNVSNFQSTEAEFAYAREVAALVGPGTHAIVDTSRNGAGPAGSEWCNPPGRLVGDAAGTLGDDIVDTNLWIKPPGESDGTCRGGPPAGSWWPAAAAELTRGVR